MSSKIERLGRSYRVRAALFIDLLESQIAKTTGRQSGFAEALKVLLKVVHTADKEVLSIIALNAKGKAEAEDYEDVLTSSLQVLRTRIETYDAHFSRQSRPISPAIDYLLSREALKWGVSTKSVIVTVGEPDNFSCGEPTFGLATPKASQRILAISVPRIEGVRASWLPIILGHELAHYLMNHKSLPRYKQLIDRVEASIDSWDKSAKPRLRAKVARAMGADQSGEFVDVTLKRIAAEWIRELICDAYAVAKFGPAGYAAMSEHLGALGDPQTIRTTHPPSTVRAQMMSEWLRSERALDPFETELVVRFDDIIQVAVSLPVEYQPIYDAIKAERETIWADVKEWMKTGNYWEDCDVDRIQILTKSIQDGIPPIQVIDRRNIHTARPAEIINAAWHARFGAPETFPVDELAMKALEDFHFIETWVDAKGKIEKRSEAPLTRNQGPGVLAESALKSRLNSVAAKGRIIMTPLMEGAIGESSVDIRLGNQFIVFDRTAYPAFDSFSEDKPDPRSMQHKIAKAWGEVFYLHPGQLVLAAALEYLVMPDDLSAQVITRSSFGRLGLISATAIQVHPNYSGCLTLELVNLGEIPIAITPGERVAQLMFFTTVGDVPRHEGKYRYPVGPEFSKVSEDDEWHVLSAMRTQHATRARASR